MAKPSEWIDKWLKTFVRRLKPVEWPVPGTDEFDDFRDDWIDAMDRRNVSEEEGDTVLRRLREDPPQWLREHLPKFIRTLEAIRRERSNESAATDRDAAFAASKDCRWCSGSGQATVFHPKYDGNVVLTYIDRFGHEKNIAARVIAHCECAMGRWMRSKIRDLDLLSRIPDLLDVLGGSRWVAVDPMGDRPYAGPKLSVDEMKRRVAKGATP